MDPMYNIDFSASWQSHTPLLPFPPFDNPQVLPEECALIQTEMPIW